MSKKILKIKSYEKNNSFEKTNIVKDKWERIFNIWQKLEIINCPNLRYSEPYWFSLKEENPCENCFKTTCNGQTDFKYGLIVLKEK